MPRFATISPSFGPRALSLRIVGALTPHDAVEVQELLELAHSYYGYETVTLHCTDAGATPRAAAILVAAVEAVRALGVTVHCSRDGRCGRNLAGLFPDVSAAATEPRIRCIGFMSTVRPEACP